LKKVGGKMRFFLTGKHNNDIKESERIKGDKQMTIYDSVLALGKSIRDLTQDAYDHATDPAERRRLAGVLALIDENTQKLRAEAEPKVGELADVKVGDTVEETPKRGFTKLFKVTDIFDGCILTDGGWCYYIKDGKCTIDDRFFIAPYRAEAKPPAKFANVKVGDWVEIDFGDRRGIHKVVAMSEDNKKFLCCGQFVDKKTGVSELPHNKIIRIVPPSEVPVTITLTSPIVMGQDDTYFLLKYGCYEKRIRFNEISEADQAKVKQILKAQE
jgi:hypothetical protein